MTSVVLDDRQMCDLEMLLNGGFDPLKGFLNERNYHCVLDDLRLITGELWPMPIVLPIKCEIANKMKPDEIITLRNKEFLPIATLKIEDIYKPDFDKECNKVFGCVDDGHPYMSLMLANTDVMYIGGSVTVIQMPPYFDFVEYRMTPKETKEFFKKNGDAIHIIKAIRSIIKNIINGKSIDVDGRLLCGKQSIRRTRK